MRLWAVYGYITWGLIVVSFIAGFVFLGPFGPTLAGFGLVAFGVMMLVYRLTEFRVTRRRWIELRQELASDQE